MRYYVAYNGWMGNGPVAVLVAAPNEEMARGMALASFEEAKPGDGDAYDTWTTITTIEEVTLPLVAEIDY